MTDELIEQFINTIIEEARIQLRKEVFDSYEISINYAYRTLYEEAVRMYDSFIEQYYLYETKSYYRHYVGVGTGTGENLYYGKQFNYVPGLHPSLTIEFSGDDMASYKKASTMHVLSLVMKGIRGIPSNKGWWRYWTGEYICDYFQINGTMETAFNVFEMIFDDMVDELFYKKLNALSNSGKYMFI